MVVITTIYVDGDCVSQPLEHDLAHLDENFFIIDQENMLMAKKFDISLFN
jgi:hypothetical protein